MTVPVTTKHENGLEMRDNDTPLVSEPGIKPSRKLRVTLVVSVGQPPFASGTSGL